MLAQAPEDDALVAKAKALLALAKQYPVDPRVLTLLELIGEPDGEVMMGGLIYSVDGNDVSTAIGPMPSSQILYLLGGSDLVLAIAGERDELDRLTIDEALSDLYRLVELSEKIDA